MRFWEFGLVVAFISLAWRFASNRGQEPNLVDSRGIATKPGSRKMATYDQFILFGDSLFQHSSNQQQGFVLAPALQGEYIRRLDVLNRGFSGYNTDQALEILPKVIPPTNFAKIRFLVILFGANDSCLKGAQGGQHVPLDRFQSNLEKIITHKLVVEHRPRIILVTPPPMNEYAAEENDRTKDAARNVSQALDVTLLDLWGLFMKHAGWSEGMDPLPGSKKREPNPFLRMLLHDGLHFTNIAYTLFQQEIMRTVNRVWPDQMPERLPFVLPMWNEPEQWEDMRRRDGKGDSANAN